MTQVCIVCGKVVQPGELRTSSLQTYKSDPSRCDGKLPLQAIALSATAAQLFSYDTEQRAFFIPNASIETGKEEKKEKEEEEKGGLRYDSGKPRYDLIPPDALAEYVKVLTLGAEKYEPRNWEKGMKWSRCVGPMLRHIFAWLNGETFDPETNCHHLAHVAWNALALVAYSKRRIGENDLPLVEKDLT